MKKHPAPRLKPINRKSAQGVVLLEALISVLIFCLAILGLISVQALVIKNNAQNGYRADATTVAQRVLSDIQLVPTAITTGTFTNAAPGAASPAWGTIASTTLPGGQVVVAATGTQVTITVSWLASAEMQAQTNNTYRHQYQLVAQLNVNDI